VKHVDVQRYPDSTDLFIQDGLNVASVDGAFEVDAVTEKNGKMTLWQVHRDAKGVHRIRQLIPPAKVDPTFGLPNFFHAVLRDSSGKVAADVPTLPFCPAGGGYGTNSASRTDDRGPIQPSYPTVCGSPMTRATVWGIDQGWASTVFLDINGDGIVDGDYTLDLTIAPTWMHQLDIPAKSASVHLALTLTTQSDCPPPGPCEPPSGAAPSSARTTSQHQEGPRNVTSGETFGNNGVGNGAGVPDMGALPAHDMSTENNADDHHDYLDFGATISNVGSGPLVVEGFRQGDKPLMTAKQYVYQNGKPVRSATVGQFEFDTRPGHNHWHMEDIAQYDLLDASGQRVVLSDKQSFCLAPTDPVDLLLKGADWQPDRTALWSACAGDSSIWLREVLPAGWGDTYYQDVAGQSFDITDLPNGRYQVRVTSDPNHKLLETDYTNNSAVQPIQIGGPAGNRTVTLVK
jgi:hypothetical protein